LYVAEQGCNEVGYRKDSGIGTVFILCSYRWAKKGVLDRVFAELQESDLINIQVDHVALDSTAVKDHPDGTGALKNGEQCIGK
jgi:hypothetical protein